MDPSPGGHLLAGTLMVGVRAFSLARGWTSTPLPVPQAYAMLSMPSAPGLVLVAGVESSSGGRERGKVGVAERRGERWVWTPLGEGEELPAVYGLDASPRHGRYAAAGAGGVFLLERAPEENRPLRRGGPTRR